MIRAGDIGVLGALAVLAYLACIWACIRVLLPHRLVFSFRGSTLIEAARDAQSDLEETLEVATGWVESFLEDNRSELEKLTRSYTVACFALGARSCCGCSERRISSDDDGRCHTRYRNEARPAAAA